MVVVCHSGQWDVSLGLVQVKKEIVVDCLRVQIPESLRCAVCQELKLPTMYLPLQLKNIITNNHIAYVS